jgi:hypothetical protein
MCELVNQHRVEHPRRNGPKTVRDADLSGSRATRTPPLPLVAYPADRAGAHSAQVLVRQLVRALEQSRIIGMVHRRPAQEPLNELVNDSFALGCSEPRGDQDHDSAVLPRGRHRRSPFRAGPHYDRRGGWYGPRSGALHNHKLRPGYSARTHRRQCGSAQDLSDQRTRVVATEAVKRLRFRDDKDLIRRARVRRAR